MPVEITHVGNEGFLIATAAARIYIDAFYGAIPSVGSPPALDAENVRQASLILVTHSHWDHFDPRAVALVASRTGASVVGPRSVVRTLRRSVPDSSLVELEPPRAPKGAFARSQKIELPGAAITAFRTFHSSDHNSYLVETPALRFFHDGDNENTTRIDVTALRPLDALFIAPWQGSGWVDLIEKLAPVPWFIMHLTRQELDLHEAGRFLPDLCDHVPAGLIALRPGRSVKLP
ncbi:MAG: MBL fold metallo-hydrolase [Planctomycetota bacterium]